MTWVKGHATQEYVDWGITTPEQLVRNERADELARHLKGKGMDKSKSKGKGGKKQNPSSFRSKVSLFL